MYIWILEDTMQEEDSVVQDKAMAFKNILIQIPMYTFSFKIDLETEWTYL